MSQYSYHEFEKFVSKCLEISNQASDKNNFISLYNLANRFNAEINLRPLLVEGMLASKLGGNSDKKKWTIFIDSETFNNISLNDLKSESIESPLPERMRNTVAHELAHTLAFVELEEGFKLSKLKTPKVTKDKFIVEIERETEKLSPLLLISDLFLDNYFSSKLLNINIADLIQLRKQTGVSRYVLINRLSLLKKYDSNDICARPPLRNLIIGIGHWKTKNMAVFKKWPVFLNIDGNIAPTFLIKSKIEQELLVQDIFKDHSFSLLGGENLSTISETEFGTSKTRGSRIKIRCTVENSERINGKEFFYIIQKLD